MSPDLVIFSGGSSFGLFSSASFASDVHKHDSLASQISQVVNWTVLRMKPAMLSPSDSIRDMATEMTLAYSLPLPSVEPLGGVSALGITVTRWEI